MKKKWKSGEQLSDVFDSSFESLCLADLENQIHFSKYFGHLRRLDFWGVCRGSKASGQSPTTRFSSVFPPLKIFGKETGNGIAGNWQNKCFDIELASPPYCVLNTA